MKRLSRLDWINTEAPLYFVTICTHARAHLLANEPTHLAFRRFCENAKERGVLVGRYALMPDHLHLFACVLPGPMTLSNWVKSLKNSLSKHWRERGMPSPHWQKGFFDHLMRSHESEAEKWLYVKQNPVRAGMCETPEDWAYGGEILPFVQR